MKKSTKSKKNNDKNLSLNLPDFPKDTPKNPGVTTDENLKLCEQMLEIWNKERFKNPKATTPSTKPFILK